MLNHVSDSLREVLAGCGMHDRTAGTGLVVLNKGPALSTMASSGGVAADAREGGQERPPIGRLGGARQPMGMEPGKGRGPKPAPVQQGRSVSIKQARRHPFLVVIADNVDVVPTRQGRISKRPSLVCIEGGKL